LFNEENINKYKRMTAKEYLNGVVRTYRRVNTRIEELCNEYQIHIDWLINKAECELCGAPHAIITDPGAPVVLKIAYFFSGNNIPSEKDKRFIDHFKQEFLSQ
jgi:hypothetical protein